MNGYQRAAQRLHGLSQSEQEWLLARLSLDDRQKIAAARDAMEANARRESDAIALQQSAADTIRRWNGETIWALLSDEPLWVAALVLSQLEPALAESVTEQIEPPRSEAVRVARERASTVKPRVVELLLRALVEKSKRREQKEGRLDFAATLRRFADERQGVSKAP